MPTPVIRADGPVGASAGPAGASAGDKTSPPGRTAGVAAADASHDVSGAPAAASAATAGATDANKGEGAPPPTAAAATGAPIEGSALSHIASACRWLAHHQATHGHTNIPREHALQSWLVQRRADAGRLTKEQKHMLQGRGHRLQLLLRANLWAAAGQGGGVAAGGPQNQSIAQRSGPPDAPPHAPWVAKRYLDADMRWKVTAPGKEPPGEAIKVLPFLADYPQKKQQKKPAEQAAGVRKDLSPKKTPEPTRRSTRLRKTPRENEEAAPTSSARADTNIRVPAMSPREARAKRRRLAEASVANHESKDALIDRFLQARASRKVEKPKREEGQDSPLLDKPPGLQKSSPRKANYTEEDIQAAARSNDAMLHQPCTVQNGRIASGFLALTLPPYPERIGLVLDDNPIFGFPEIQSLSAASPIASQIPLDFRSDCLITSIESTRLGRVVPQSGRHCGEVLNLARGKGLGHAKAARVTVAFAKNPLALYVPKDDPLRTGRALPATAVPAEPHITLPAGPRKRCSGPCRMERAQEEYSVAQWGRPATERLCTECGKIKTELGEKHFRTYMAQYPPVVENESDGGKERKKCAQCKVKKAESEYSTLQWTAPHRRVCMGCMKTLAARASKEATKASDKEKWRREIAAKYPPKS